MLVLGIESSCDETAAAILKDGNELLANVVDSQISIHGKYGGVVPELASRRHIETIYPVVQTALHQANIHINELDGIAATQGPGLIGSLLVGFSFAKGLSMVAGIPYVGVSHMSGHILSVFLSKEVPVFPYIALIASGGHTSIFFVNDPFSYDLLGRTRDDAAGEAFDKVAKILNLGYPGGPIISDIALQGNPTAISFPRAWLDTGSLDFSFSGLKTSVINYVHNLQQKEKIVPIEDIGASFQEAVVEVLTEKAIMAAKHKKVKQLVLAGGVAANPRLRFVLKERCDQEDLQLFMPPVDFCTDNAAMVALSGTYLLEKGERADLSSDVYSRISSPPLTG